MMKKVLIVDDSATVRQQVRAALGMAEFDVVEASDGTEGAEMINRLTDLAAVICDVNMPRMNGLEMLETVKKDPKNTALPIVMLTTEGQHELVQRAKAAGAKGWIVKPFKPELLLAAIRKLTTV
jgi:two-component system chemotaxis response regulator CheY